MKEEFQPKRIVSYVLIGLIAFIFMVQWGPGSRGCEAPVNSSGASAAFVNGKEIPLREFQREYALRLRGQTIPESLAQQLGMPKRILDSMIEAELLAQAGKEQGITASAAEMREILFKEQAFHENGRFSFDRYREVLRDNLGKTPDQYEDSLRQQLVVGKLRNLIESAAVVSDDEVKARYWKDGNKAAATYVRFLPTMFASKVSPPTAAEIAAYKKDHAKEVSEYYEANQFLYQQPERVRARHILIKAEKDAPADKKADAKKRLEELRKQIEGGKDFAAVAKESSEDVGSKVNGGDLGFNERQAWVPEFSAVAFSLKPGEMSQPVETQFGFHLIKVEEKKAAEKKELKDVEDEIAKQQISREKAKELARVEAEKALASAKAGKKLADLFPAEKEQPAAMRFETETKPEAVQTGEFGASGGSIPRLGPAEELSTSIFGAKGPQLLDKVFSVGEGFVIAEVTERKQPSDQDFTAQKDKLRAEAQRAKGVELWEAYLKALKSASKVTINQEALGGGGGGADQPS